MNSSTSHSRGAPELFPMTKFAPSDPARAFYWCNGALRRRLIYICFFNGLALVCGLAARHRTVPAADVCIVAARTRPAIDAKHAFPLQPRRVLSTLTTTDKFTKHFAGKELVKHVVFDFLCLLLQVYCNCSRVCKSISS